MAELAMLDPSALARGYISGLEMLQHGIKTEHLPGWRCDAVRDVMLAPWYQEAAIAAASPGIGGVSFDHDIYGTRIISANAVDTLARNVNAAIKMQKLYDAAFDDLATEANGLPDAKDARIEFLETELRDAENKLGARIAALEMENESLTGRVGELESYSSALARENDLLKSTVAFSGPPPSGIPDPPRRPDGTLAPAPKPLPVLKPKLPDRRVGG